MDAMHMQQQMLEKQLLKAAEMMEEQIDSEMKKMDELDDDDIESLRQKRLKAMQRAHAAKQVSIVIFSWLFGSAQPQILKILIQILFEIFRG